MVSIRAHALASLLCCAAVASACGGASARRSSAASAASAAQPCADTQPYEQRQVQQWIQYTGPGDIKPRPVSRRPMFGPWATVRYIVDPDGRVEVGSLMIIETRRIEADEAFVRLQDGVQKWSYAPALRDGCRVRAAAERVVAF